MSKQIATREAYGNALAELVQENDNVVVLDADLSGSTKTANARAVVPERHFNMGIAEGNMMSVAAGFAASGKIAFASTFAMFAAGRAFEQIRNSIAYPELNVKVCATHSGITVGEDGASHQAIEDLALMRSVPNMTVIQPADARETEEAVKAIAKHEGPVYMRLGRLAVDQFNNHDDYKFEIGKGNVIRKGEKVAIVATGMMVQESLKAVEQLEAAGFNPTIINIHTIKPLDTELILETAKTHDVIVTAEEHNIMGGLGSAIAEYLAIHHPTKMVMIGVNDTFGESGKPEDLKVKYGLTADNIAKRIIEEV